MRSANSGMVSGGCVRVSASQGRTIQSTISGTSTSQILRSSACSGTRPASCRVLRRARTTIAPTVNQ
jgi:hypothetical protein